MATNASQRAELHVRFFFNNQGCRFFGIQCGEDSSVIFVTLRQTALFFHCLRHLKIFPFFFNVVLRHQTS